MDKTKTIIIVMLTLLVILLSGYIAYDKLLSKELKIEVENQQTPNKEATINADEEKKNNNNVNTSQYDLNDFKGTVFQLIENTDNREANLVLWADQTFEYTYTTKENNKEGYLGKYKVDTDNIVLTYMFEYDYISKETDSQKDMLKIITEDSPNKLLKINEKYELFDQNEKITLNKVNQPPSPGGENYYSIIHNYN